jgi:hypothetical protein
MMDTSFLSKKSLTILHYTGSRYSIKLCYNNFIVSSPNHQQFQSVPHYETFATSANGIPIGFDRVGSHLATHLHEIPVLEELLNEILPNEVIDASGIEVGDFIRLQKEVGWDRGITTDQVSITAADDIYYAIRRNRTSYTKFARGREPEPTNVVTAILRKVEHPDYDCVLWSAWTGKIAPSFPSHELAQNDPAAFEAGVRFWSQDVALTDTSMEILPGTERQDNPWVATVLAFHAMNKISLDDETWRRVRKI